VFLGVSLFTLGIQIILIQWCGAWIETDPNGLTIMEWIYTVALGAIGLPVGVLMRFIPVKEDPNDFFQSALVAPKPKVVEVE
jgi:hypothetical protein